MLPIPEVSLEQLARECRAALKFRLPGEIAVFDADGTLWAPDIANRLWKTLLEERVLRSPGSEAVFDAMTRSGLPSTGDAHVDALQLLAAYFVGKVDEEVIVRVMINGLAGLSRADVDALVLRALHQNQPPFADEAHLGMADFVRELQAMGMRIIIVSGSPVWAVAAGAKALQLPIEITLAGDVLHRAGRLTTEIVEPLTFRGGKGRSYDQNIGKAPLFAFGDGESDIPLLERARILSVAVNPRPSLRKAMPAFGTRARVLSFSQTAAGRFISAPTQDESVD